MYYYSKCYQLFFRFVPSLILNSAERESSELISLVSTFQFISQKPNRWFCQRLFSVLPLRLLLDSRAGKHARVLRYQNSVVVILSMLRSKEIQSKIPGRIFIWEHWTNISAPVPNLFGTDLSFYGVSSYFCFDSHQMNASSCRPYCGINILASTAIR